ncbi:hypothetical protein [Ovoidimarina sediminis]|uniref:hypothetical protein n=1 Tax=Ovoidimarina sediminis TaxID=3079856 RepID=UPI0029072757|nr:hypothetical protein [Rhodophyticola sp. MJ-SS7]MDU8946276.1 hypothetical protein [Rhodophyticola sp. MJ-SS7]
MAFSRSPALLAACASLAVPLLLLTAHPAGAQAACLKKVDVGEGANVLLQNVCNRGVVFSYHGGNSQCRFGAGGKRYPCQDRVSAGRSTRISVVQGAGRINWTACYYDEWAGGRCRLE